MSTQLIAQPAKPSALAVMAGRVNVEPAKLLQTLKSTVFKGASDDELLALVVVANEYGLNPLLKELYAFPAKGGGIVPVVSVDGWVRMVNDHPQMDGMEFDEHYDEAGKLEAITCKLWRKDRNRPVMVTEHLSECRRNTDPWKMEHRMLRHKSLMQCARYAFGFSGVTDEDEAWDTPGMRDVTPSNGRVTMQETNPWAEESKPESKPAATETAKTEEAVETEASFASEEATSMPSRKEMAAEVKEAMAQAEITLPAAEARLRAAGLLAEGKTLSKTTDDELFAITQNLGAILNPEPAKA